MTKVHRLRRILWSDGDESVLNASKKLLVNGLERSGFQEGIDFTIIGTTNIKEALNTLDEENLDLVICATRSDGTGRYIYSEVPPETALIIYSSQAPDSSLTRKYRFIHKGENPALLEAVRKFLVGSEIY